MGRDVRKTPTIGNEVPLQPHQGEHTQVNTNTHRHANPGGVDVDDSEKQGYSFLSWNDGWSQYGVFGCLYIFKSNKTGMTPRKTLLLKLLIIYEQRISINKIQPARLLVSMMAVWCQTYCAGSPWFHLFIHLLHKD